MALTSNFFMLTIPEGTKNQLWAASAPNSEIENGGYYHPVGSKNAGSALARNEKLAQDLWTWTEGEIKKHGF
jgi:hypothetical protein